MVDELITFLLLLLLTCTFYFIFHGKRYKYNKLKKGGVKIPAKVISINETNSFIGDDSFSIPILEIVFEFEYLKDVTRKETISYAFSKWERVPKTGDTIIILVDKTAPHNFDIFKGDL